jgi:hypothetical protein
MRLKSKLSEDLASESSPGSLTPYGKPLLSHQSEHNLADVIHVSQRFADVIWNRRNLRDICKILRRIIGPTCILSCFATRIWFSGCLSHLPLLPRPNSEFSLIHGPQPLNCINFPSSTNFSPPSHCLRDFNIDAHPLTSALSRFHSLSVLLSGDR